MTVVILSALAIIGLQNSVDLLLKTFTDGGIEYHLDLLSFKAPTWVFHVLKPLISCVYCMCSFWGTIFYFTFSFIEGGGIIGWLPSIFAIAGLIHVIHFFEHD